jgi:hypothetical protein
VVTKSIIPLSVFGTGIDRRFSPRYALLVYFIILLILRKRLLCKKTMQCRIGSTCFNVSAIPFFPARCKDQSIVSVIETFSTA